MADDETANACPKCGSRAKEGDTYCTECGTKLDIPLSDNQHKPIESKYALTKHMFYIGIALFVISLVLLSVFVIIDKNEPSKGAEGIMTEQDWLNLKNQVESDMTGYYTLTGDKSIYAEFEEPIKNESSPWDITEPININVKLTNKLPDEIPSSKIRVKLTGEAFFEGTFSDANEPFIEPLKGIDTTSSNENSKSITIGPLQYERQIMSNTKSVTSVSGRYCYQIPMNIKAKLFYTELDDYIGKNLNNGSNPPSPIQIISLQQEPIVFINNKGELSFETTIKKIGQTNSWCGGKHDSSSFIPCNGGNILPSMSECFKERRMNSVETVHLSGKAAYPVECENEGELQLPPETREATIKCKVTDIPYTELGKIPSDLTLTLDNFAYEGVIISPKSPVSLSQIIEIWVENKPKSTYIGVSPFIPGEVIVGAEME